VTPLALGLLAAAVAFPQSFGGPWSGWHEVRPLALTPPQAPQFVRVALAGIDPGSDGTFPSVRIVDDYGVEVPYALDPDSTQPLRGTPLPLSDTGFVAGRYTQAVVDFGANPETHAAVRLESPRQTYLERVSVEASDDRATWRLMRTDALIYRVAGSSQDRGDQTVAFDPTHARWLRLRVLDGREPFPVAAVYVDVRRAERDALLASGAPGKATTGRELGSSFQRWTFDFGSRYAEAAAVRLSGAPIAFDRTVRIETSDDTENWTYAASEVEIRQAAGDPDATAAFEPQYARRWRVTLVNGGDSALAGAVCELLAPPHDLVFAAVPGRRYALLAGNPVVSQPQYDLGKVLARRDWHADTVAPPGAPLNNASYADPRPLTERLPWLVNLAFALASLVIGAIAIATVRVSMRTST